jgi:hypothetical protein
LTHVGVATARVGHAQKVVLNQLVGQPGSLTRITFGGARLIATVRLAVDVWVTYLATAAVLGRVALLPLTLVAVADFVGCAVGVFQTIDASAAGGLAVAARDAVRAGRAGIVFGVNAHVGRDVRHVGGIGSVLRRLHISGVGDVACIGRHERALDTDLLVRAAVPSVETVVIGDALEAS